MLARLAATRRAVATSRHYGASGEASLGSNPTVPVKRLAATIAGLLVALIGGGACAAPNYPAQPLGATTSTTSPGDPTTRATREPFSRAQLARAQSLASGFVARLVSDTPELTGMTVAAMAPVFDEDTLHPIGAMARLQLPAVVPSVTLGLVRSRAGAPEVVESEITNLYGLDAIILFTTGQMVTLAVAPEASFANDPATATMVRPVAPDSHRSPEFGDTD